MVPANTANGSRTRFSKLVLHSVHWFGKGPVHPAQEESHGTHSIYPVIGLRLL